MIRDQRITIIIITGLMLVCIFLGYRWFHENFAFKEVEESTGYSSEARRNKFLAAEYFLRELGAEVESNSNRARLLEISSEYKTILINDYGPKLSPTHFKELKLWLENGGHLIFTASDFEYSYSEDNENAEYNYNYDYDFKNNQLLEEIGVIPRYTDFDDNLSYPEDEKPLKVTLNNGQVFEATFSPDYHLIDINDSAIFSIEDRFGKHLLQFNIGAGKLTVLSDNEFLNNNNIKEHDHAYLLWLLSSAELSTSTSKNNSILLLYNNESDSIFSLIWNHAKQACIAFLTFLVLGLWSMRNRFGPILPNTNFSNRNIVEHLRAIARFSWRQDRGVHLLKQSREQCENSLLTRYPALKDMSAKERLEHIADILDIEPEKVHSALYFEPRSTSEYINSSHYLQKIWILQ